MFPFKAMFDAIRHIDSPLKFVAYVLAVGASLAALYVMARDVGL